MRYLLIPFLGTHLCFLVLSASQPGSGSIYDSNPLFFSDTGDTDAFVFVVLTLEHELEF